MTDRPGTATSHVTEHTHDEADACGCGHDHHAHHHGHHHHMPSLPLVRQGAKVGRNDPCPCGSGKKHKKCCLAA